MGTNALSACYTDSKTGEVKEPGRKLFAKLRMQKHKLGATPAEATMQRPAKRGAAVGSMMKTSAVHRTELETDSSGKHPVQIRDRKVKPTAQKTRKRKQEEYKLRTAVTLKAATKQLKVERDVAVTERDVAISERDAMHAELTALRAASSPPTNDQLIDMFEKHSRKRLKTGRHYTVEGYEAFRDLVCGAGLPMQQVNHVINVAFKLLVGREVDFKISRTPVRTAIMALGVCDDLDERLADSGRKHQLIFDESAHILLIASAHWNHELRRPELTVLAAIRLDKQTGQILAEKVHDGTSHIPADSIISTLSDNCKAMDGVYKGANL